MALLFYACILYRVDTWFRSRMGNTRLSGLTLLHVYSDVTINLENVIDRFVKQKNKTRKRTLILLIVKLFNLTYYFLFVTLTLISHRHVRRRQKLNHFKQQCVRIVTMIRFSIERLFWIFGWIWFRRYSFSLGPEKMKTTACRRKPSSESSKQINYYTPRQYVSRSRVYRCVETSFKRIHSNKVVLKTIWIVNHESFDVWNQTAFVTTARFIGGVISLTAADIIVVMRVPITPTGTRRVWYANRWPFRPTRVQLRTPRSRVHRGACLLFVVLMPFSPRCTAPVAPGLVFCFPLAHM